MTTIQSGLTLLNYGTTWSWPGSGGIRLYDQYTHDYATMYRTQPNVRTCVDFLARNIAQLGLHVYRRVSDTDRKRLIAKDHALAAWVARPNAFMTSYRNIFDLVADWGIYNQVFWLKQIAEGLPISTQRLPPYVVQVSGGLNPTGYAVDYADGRKVYTPEQMVHFRGYNPSDGRVGLSPLETLRRVLAEEHAMGEYREHYWQNAAKMDGVIERPEQKSGKSWSETAKTRFIKDLHDLHANVETAGDTLVLEDGMSWKQISFNAQESEYIMGRKLTREECASAYHIPLPMVGILDHATFSNIKEQHKNLYADCLGPLLTMITEEIELQLMPEFADTADVYLEFNILEKMAGSFEEQGIQFQAAVGRPWMTANEARARLNMRSMGGDADELVTPLNVLTGGQANPQDSAPGKGQTLTLPSPFGRGMDAKAEGEDSSRGDADERPSPLPLPSGEGVKGAVRRLDPTRPKLRARYAEKWAEVMGKYFKRQGAAVRARMPKANLTQSRKGAEERPSPLPLPSGEGVKAAVNEVWGDSKRWNAELKKDLFKLNRETAWVWASFVAAQLDAPIAAEPMDAYLDENATWGAEDINDTTKAQVEAALKEDDPASALERVFEIAVAVRAVQIGITKVTGMASFGAHEGARQGGLQYKTWQTNSANPRPEHAAMAGSTVKLDELFYQTGQRWPGDPAGGADNNANCFPGDTRVSPAGLQLAYRRWYKGDLIEITTALGNKFSATPNHPILTMLGWRPVNLLAEGDYIISCLRSEDIAFVDPNIQHMNTPISKIFDFLAIYGARQGISGVVEQFHGDGQNGQVDIIASKGQLGDRFNTPVMEPFSKEALTLTDKSLGTLLPEGALGHFGIGAPLPPNSGMGSLGISAAINGTHPTVPNELSLSAGARGDASFDQSATDCATSIADTLSNRLFGLSGLIAIDQIVKVERVAFAGHVYNLQTRDGWYIANSIIAHNCQCSISFSK